MDNASNIDDDLARKLTLFPNRDFVNMIDLPHSHERKAFDKFAAANKTPLLYQFGREIMGKKATGKYLIAGVLKSQLSS